MDEINVNFTDSTKTTINQYFGCPQNVSIYPNCGTVTATDDRWKTFYDAQPAFVKPSLPSPA